MLTPGETQKEQEPDPLDNILRKGVIGMSKLQQRRAKMVADKKEEDDGSDSSGSPESPEGPSSPP